MVESRRHIRKSDLRGRETGKTFCGIPSFEIDIWMDSYGYYDGSFQRVADKEICKNCLGSAKKERARIKILHVVDRT